MKNQKSRYHRFFQATNTIPTIFKATEEQNVENQLMGSRSSIEISPERNLKPTYMHEKSVDNSSEIEENVTFDI